MYRGWYKGEREFGSAKVPWEFCLAEWNAQFLGDRAYADQRAGEGEPALGGETISRRQPLASLGLSQPGRLDALRRTISGVRDVPHGQLARLSHLGRVRDFAVGVRALLEAARRRRIERRKELKVDWENLQRPGFSPDYSEQRYERMDLAFERADWIATPAAEALLRNNRPLLAYLGGKPDRFTSKDHIFVPGRNASRNRSSSSTIRARRDLRVPMVARPAASPSTGSKTIHGGDGRAGAHPAALRAAGHACRRDAMSSAPASIQQRRDADRPFAIDVLPRPQPLADRARRSRLFDPKGETRATVGQARRSIASGGRRCRSFGLRHR